MNQPAFKLSDQQQFAMTDLTGTEDFYCLKGYAGTGKTTVITHWIKEENPRSVVLTAPTNKATNVLREMARKHPLDVEVRTIHSLLSLKLKWQQDEQVLVQDDYGDDNFGDYQWVVIDECSMLDQEMMAYIRNAQHNAGNKVIYMGDPCQLPPIADEGESLSFAPPAQSELTTVMRQADGNPILELSKYLRKLILSDRPHYPDKIFSFVDDKHILYHPVTQYEDEILQAFHDVSDKDIRHMAWTNKVVNSWNDKIRDKIYGFDREDWTEGEQIVTTAPVMDQHESTVMFTTDTLLKIQREPKETIHKEVPCWILQCRHRRLYVPTREAGKAFREEKGKRLAAAKADKKQWRKFYEFIEAFAQVKPAHSLTVHRSQGSTFDDVYVSFANILSNPNRKESLQCLYVACTRPRNRLFLV